MPSRRQIPRRNPADVAMPNFASNGYAPSRAHKRRQLNCDNAEAIRVLSEEWLERQQLEIQLWNEQHPVPDIVVPINNDIPAANSMPPNATREQSPTLDTTPILHNAQPQTHQQQQQQQQQTQLENMVNHL